VDWYSEDNRAAEEKGQFSGRQALLLTSLLVTLFTETYLWPEERSCCW